MKKKTATVLVLLILICLAGCSSLQGPPGVGGAQGPQGPPGKDGPTGASAYESAIVRGFDGTEEEWLASLVGPQGPQGPAGSMPDTVAAAVTGYCGRAKINVADGRLDAFLTRGGDLVVYWQVGDSSTNYGCADAWLFVPETQPMPSAAMLTVGAARLWNADKQYLRTGVAEWKLGPEDQWGVRAAKDSFYDQWGKGCVSGQFPWTWKPKDTLTITIPLP